LLATDVAVPIALVINELIINAVKHSKTLVPNNIAIRLAVVENSATVSIQNSCNNQDLFPNFEQGVGLGLGLSLIRAMLPPQGVNLSLIKKDGLVCAELLLEQPIIIFEAKDEDLPEGSVA
jgi:two-component sensor histidine kinase